MKTPYIENASENMERFTPLITNKRTILAYYIRKIWAALVAAFQQVR